ncbi:MULTISPECIES: cytochrome c maturation protein CcmE domain-containing protein [Olivibacter]|jgi:cytochrome c-type biogenesis protein CcmE|uniref:Cytochrome c maturation protein CcmE n=3 Tax=Sphingobacteriaceae TaxID=84566 RepID=F4C230_SPHS2|nr:MULTISPECIES: cytochrome c maturation protein CcmE [Olivibacter]MCL4640791.1 cytochrome c maturation protein CcmE [Olivibacter sp. UJ_SKK_5.1]MDM8174996.1 cytochrome c maturation protein CcmE [Olivibacter sp. 47]MDX3913321.1 cytochrome c maturation protein CcmE [Pseudosphingobacterium sp.]QEL01776.1 cytochrome c maturation protein CcmE [Olivibacter sp. LS-1]
MKKGAILGIIIIAVAIAMIISIYTDSSTYATFTDAQKTESEIHVVGELNKTKALYYNPTENANYFAFYMLDNNGTECKVVFNGSKPQDFERSEQIVLTGKMVGKEFHASKILMKCPSKYNKDQVEVTESASTNV